MSGSGAKIPTQIWDRAVDGRTHLLPARSALSSFSTCLAIIAASTVAILELLQARMPWLPLVFSGAAGLLAGYLLFVHYRRYRVLECAVGNMWQGLAVFDAGGRLVFHNSQFCTLLGLAPADVERSATHRGIIALLIKAGGYDGLSAEGVWGADSAFISRRQAALDYIELPGLRTIAQSHEPLSDGGWVRTYADVTRRRQVEARIVHLAHHDALTDLPNRLLFRERLQDALLDATDRSRVAVMIFDLNRFKEVNDGFGHAVGDQLLAILADRARRALRPNDTLARLGGDEFAILQPAIESVDEASGLALRVIAACEAPFEIGGATVSVGLSIGICFAPADGVDTDSLLQRADEAMYGAKSEARSAYRFFSEMAAL